MKKYIPLIISFLSWVVLLIVDTLIEIQDNSFADRLNNVFSGIGFNKVTLMGININTLDNTYSVGIHFFIILLFFLLIGLFFSTKTSKN
ncbi:hypothetical protein [Companilactobacillus sp. DQM5]|uniref:hypothetical protein n=1 Tax=Companilactobacillus sp. DQM5 TaxID=3463359 RepID=UPI00405846FD